MLRNRRKIAILTFGAIAVACVLAAVVDVTLQAPSIQPFYTANPSGITFTEVRIPLRDGNSLAGYVALPSNYNSIPVNSACLTIISPGVNGRKETILWKAYNFALHGFVAIAIEARGHGSSTGICSIGIEEPRDISDAITWALATYSKINSSRVSLYGQSLGGMFTVTAACQDARVAATVALHPPANLSWILAPFYPLASLLGYIPSFQLDQDSINLRSPISWIKNATTPRNILFLHGDQDTLVSPENSLSLSLRINSTGRSINDSYVIIRPGLSHPGNEADHYTLALGIAWLNWSLTQGVRPLPDTLTEQAGNITIEDTPIGSIDRVAYLLLVATAAVFVFILLVLRKPQAGMNLPPNPPATVARASWKGGIVLLAITLGVAFILGVTNVIPFIWAYLLVMPLIAVGTYLFLGAFLSKKGVQCTYVAEWRDKPRIRNVILGVGTVVGTAIFYALVYSPLAQGVMQYGIFPWSTAPLFYSSIIVLNFIIDPLILNSFSWGVPREPWVNRFKASRRYIKNIGRESFYVLIWRLASVVLCSLFLPEIFIMDFPIAINIVIIIGLPLLAALVYFLAGILNLGTKSHTVSLLIVGAIAAMYLQWRLFRFF